MRFAEALAHDPGAMIRGRLIKHIELAKRLAPILFERTLADDKAIEATAPHEEQLVAQHIARGTQLALVAIAVAQQPRLRISAAIGEFRELQHDKVEAPEIRRHDF